MHRLVRTAGAFSLASILAVTTGCQTAVAEAPSLPSDPASLISWHSPHADRCQAGCEGAAGWLDATRVSDARLREVIFVLSEYLPEFRDVLAYNLKHGTRLAVAAPGHPDAAADYDSATRVIRVSPQVIDGNIAVLGSIVAHELIHGAQDHADPERACQREVEAYAWTAVTWEHLKRLTHDPSPAYDQVAAAWRQGSLEELVASWPLYSNICGIAR